MSVTKLVLIVVLSLIVVPLFLWLLLVLCFFNPQEYYVHTDKTLSPEVIDRLRSECNQPKYSEIEGGIERCMKEKGFEKKTNWFSFP